MVEPYTNKQCSNINCSNPSQKLEVNGTDYQGGICKTCNKIYCKDHCYTKDPEGEVICESCEETSHKK